MSAVKPVELTDDPRFGRRIVRLALTSAIALGLILFLAEHTMHLPWGVEVGLAGGWLLMPAVLALSIRWPSLRYALILPSTLVSLSLLAMCLSVPVDDPLTRVGWLLVTTGVLFGGALGVWLWFRWLPVPSGLNEPFSPGRWTLIGVHVIMILAGIGLMLVRIFR